MNKNKKSLQLYHSTRYPDNLDKFIKEKMQDGWRVVSLVGDSGSAQSYREPWYACVMEKEADTKD